MKEQLEAIYNALNTVEVHGISNLVTMANAMLALQEMAKQQEEKTKE